MQNVHYNVSSTHRCHGFGQFRSTIAFCFFQSNGFFLSIDQAKCHQNNTPHHLSRWISIYLKPNFAIFIRTTNFEWFLPNFVSLYTFNTLPYRNTHHLHWGNRNLGSSTFDKKSNIFHFLMKINLLVHWTCVNVVQSQKCASFYTILILIIILTILFFLRQYISNLIKKDVIIWKIWNLHNSPPSLFISSNIFFVVSRHLTLKEQWRNNHKSIKF